MDVPSYFRSTSKSTVVSSCSDFENGNESEIDVQPNPRGDYTIFSENLIFFFLPVITFSLFLLCK